MSELVEGVHIFSAVVLLLVFGGVAHLFYRSSHWTGPGHDIRITALEAQQILMRATDESQERAAVTFRRENRTDQEYIRRELERMKIERMKIDAREAERESRLDDEYREHNAIEGVKAHAIEDHLKAIDVRLGRIEAAVLPALKDPE